ncbi:chemotaxis two-component sensor kinase [Halobacteriovorax marinus SJ]|uniref:Chemotaxis protein CheA n=2 Tax=Halobacteriovorax marinus TaxID=97084 RepID=E1X674_HALMS|nr:chemotaxis protein CheA [Halobacteriovorax marinus]CBW27419.1 chemotaxis two-component sensor kinase [Halobacteriovorax marinus SJ]
MKFTKIGYEMDDFERELKEDFLDESLQLLEDTEQSFLALENDKESTEILDQIFRLAHNLKGTSRAVGFGNVAEFTHEMENLILKLKTGELEVTDGIVSLLLECNDHITHMIHTLKDDMEADFDSAQIVANIQSALGGESASMSEEVADEVVEPEPEVPSEELIANDDNWESDEEIDDILDDAIMESSGEEASSNEPEVSAAALEALKELGNCDDSIIAELEGKSDPVVAKDEPVEEETEISAAALEALKELGTCDSSVIADLEKSSNVTDGLKFNNAKDDTPSVTPIEKSTTTPENVAPLAAKKAAAVKKVSEDESIRVSLSRVEKLNNVVGELVILQTVLDQGRFSAAQDQLMNKSISQLGKLSKEIQEISMSLRMVPVKSTLQKMNRIVRDTSKTLDKKVKLKLSGEETEIDKTVLEHLADPLVHIVRNAVDHGLESTEERIASGKSEFGNVGISAYHEGNNLVIEITDDGKGIPANVIRKKALEKGLIRENQQISDEDMIQYIFHPGFSTKEEVTEVSGRGVGMDVVKTNIEKLSGEVRVKTELGKGSVFKVVLPLTMAIIEGMVIRAGGDKFILPLSQVHESLKPTKEMVSKVTGWGECLNLRGQILPLFNIGNTLSVKMDEGSSLDKIAIIIQAAEHPFAVLVDDILHQQQVVIKNLGNEIKNNKGFMGSSILGDGKPSFILDLNELYSGKMKKNSSIKEDLMGRVA